MDPLSTVQDSFALKLAEMMDAQKLLQVIRAL